jgi:tryptophanyl-tRNA synthetase
VTKPIILTGDRTTGPLHLGHYVGSLRSRLEFQDSHQQFLLLADMQALTDNAHDIGKVSRNVIEVALDYLAVGIDPERTSICLQSQLPALAELSMLYLNLVTVARLERNPTIKDEIAPAASDAISRPASCAIRWRRPPISRRSGPRSCRSARTRRP